MHAIAWVDLLMDMLHPNTQVAKASLKKAAGALAEALAERDAAGDERAGIETQLQAALKSVAGDAATTSTGLSGRRLMIF